MSGAMSVRFNRVFTKKGQFNLKEFNARYFDPYRLDDNDKGQVELYELVFDTDGSVHQEFYDYVKDVVENKEFSATSDVVKLYYAQKHGRVTNRSYPATYMWK